MPIISSRQHPLVKQCRAIVRGDDVRLLLDGAHLLGEALASGLPIEWVAVDALRASEHASLINRAREAGASIAHATSPVLAAMSPVRTSTGVVAAGSRPTVDPRALVEPAPALVVVGLGVQDPGNVGAIVRTADAAGASGVLFDGQAADPWAWKALRASMGSTFRLPVLRSLDALDLLRHWQRGGVRVVAAAPREGRAMYDADLAGPTALVLGAEGAGVPEAALALADARVRVPMRVRVESLNVAVAAALLTYEAARQRGGLR